MQHLKKNSKNIFERYNIVTNQESRQQKDKKKNSKKSKLEGIKKRKLLASHSKKEDSIYRDLVPGMKRPSLCTFKGSLPSHGDGLSHWPS